MDRLLTALRDLQTYLEDERLRPGTPLVSALSADTQYLTCDLLDLLGDLSLIDPDEIQQAQVRSAAAIAVCEALVNAWREGDITGGSVEWERIEAAAQAASEATGLSLNAPPCPRCDGLLHFDGTCTNNEDAGCPGAEED